jgi:putative tricarboxylic transport membrane protein
MRIGNIVFSTFLIILLGGAYYSTLQLPPSLNPNAPGSAYAPRVYIISGIILCTIIIFNSIKEKTKEKFELNNRFYLYVFLSVVYFIAISFIGYYISTILILLSLLLLLGMRKWSSLLLIPVCYSIFVYAVFDLVIGLPIP